MADIELQREINALKGDINLTNLAIKSVQNEMKGELCGKMGEDMTAVLNGERFVTVGKMEQGKHKVKSWFKRIFRMF
jgi:hypothetical protein